VHQPADHDEVLPAGLLGVDRGVLAGEADDAADLGGLAADVVPGDGRLTGVGPGEGGEDADGASVCSHTLLGMSTHTAPRQIRVLGTTRLSDDPKGKRIDHKAQRRAINELVERQGWPAIADADWFSDTDKSASKDDVERPEWDRLLDTVRGIDSRTVELVVVGYAQDRMMRRPQDPKMVADLLERKRGQLWTALQGQINVRKGGRAALYFNGVVATNESETTTRRSLDGMKEAAIDGKPHGPAGYGWTRVIEGSGKGALSKNIVNPDEAAIVREMAERVLAGGSLRGIAADLNSRGVPSPNAGAVRRRDPVTREPIAWAADSWEPAKVRQILLRKANIAVRVHTTASEDDTEPVEYPAMWDAILDDDMYAQVVAVLGAPERRTSRTNIAKHWLSTIATCGVCESAVTVQSVGAKGKKYAAYRCPQAHVTKAEAKTDAAVELAVLEILSSKEARDSLRRGDGGAAEQAIERAATITTRLLELETDYMAGHVRRESWLRMSKQLNADIKAAERVLSKRRDAPVYADLVNADDLGAAWDATPLDRRRAVVSAVATVVLHRNTKRGKSAFDPETITVTPRITAEEAAA
jgi:site-specific DNA recombinase